jgi:1-phosphofructokinase family hexose kinase
MSDMIFTVTVNPALDRTLFIPRIAINQVLRANKVIENCGGKGFNVSRALKALGLMSTALGFAGGATGKKLHSELESLEIPTQFVWISNETRTNIAIFSEDERDSLKVNEAGPTISNCEQKRLEDLIDELAKPGDYWILAGSLAPGLPVDFYQNLIINIQGHGAKAILDTSGKSLLEGIKAHPFMIKPNQEEVENLLGKKLYEVADLKRASQILYANGIVWVAISCGAKGLVLTNQHGTWYTPAPPVQVVNTVGAGDALVAGLTWAMVNGCQPGDIAAWGVAAGSAAASLDGVNFGGYGDVEELFKRIESNTAII